MVWTYKPKPKGGKGKLIYKCVICEKKILKPELGQFTCRDKKCDGRYWRFRRTLRFKYSPEAREKFKIYQRNWARKKYCQDEDWLAKRKAYSKAWKKTPKGKAYFENYRRTHLKLKNIKKLMIKCVIKE